MLNYFTCADVTLSDKLLEITYIIIGLLIIYCGVKNALDKENPSRIGTCVFWSVLGIVMAFGRWIPALINGSLLLIMCVPVVMRKVQRGKVNMATKEEKEANFQKIGMKIFIPTLCMGFFSLLCAINGLGLGLSALVGMSIGVFVAMILLIAFNKNNTPKVFLNDFEALLTNVGPVILLPLLLACLGAVFNQAGVGTVIGTLLGKIIPEGNIYIGIIVYAVGMALFTFIMGNAFAAITVMTVGVGAPFVLAYGANPVAIGMLALTCGYCGTLCTPMAASANIFPVSVLEMKNTFGVIKNQIPVAAVMLVVQIIMMFIMK